MGCDYHQFVLKKDVKAKKAFSDSRYEVDFKYVMLCCVDSKIDVMTYMFDNWSNSLNDISEKFAECSFVHDKQYTDSFRKQSNDEFLFPKSCKADVMKWFALIVKQKETKADCSKEIHKVLKNIKCDCINAFKKLGIEKEVFYDSNARSCEYAGDNDKNAFIAYATTC